MKFHLFFKINPSSIRAYACAVWHLIVINKDIADIWECFQSNVFLICLCVFISLIFSCSLQLLKFPEILSWSFNSIRFTLDIFFWGNSFCSDVIKLTGLIWLNYYMNRLFQKFWKSIDVRKANPVFVTLTWIKVVFHIPFNIFLN